MTQPDPLPAAIPDAIPILPYATHADDQDMIWVVRFIGAWFICHGATRLEPDLASTFRNGTLDVAYWSTTLSLLFDVLYILFGIAAIRRQRPGLLGLLALTIASLASPLLMFGPGLLLRNLATALAVLPTALLTDAVQFAVLLSILRRADASGVLMPFRPDNPAHPPAGNNIHFLASRLGWIFLACGGQLVTDLFILPLAFGKVLPSALRNSLWNWQSIAQMTLLLAITISGLLLARRWLPALWFLIILVPLHAVGDLAAVIATVKTSFPPSTLASIYILASFSALSTAVLLYLLARKAARSSFP